MVSNILSSSPQSHSPITSRGHKLTINALWPAPLSLWWYAHPQTWLVIICAELCDEYSIRSLFRPYYQGRRKCRMGPLVTLNDQEVATLIWSVFSTNWYLRQRTFCQPIDSRECGLLGWGLLHQFLGAFSLGLSLSLSDRFRNKKQRRVIIWNSLAGRAPGYSYPTSRLEGTGSLDRYAFGRRRFSSLLEDFCWFITLHSKKWN